MSVPSNDVGILIIDSRPLRGAGIAAVVQRLSGSNCRIASIGGPSDAEQWIDGGVKFRMIIYSIGSDSVGQFRHRKRIKKLGRLAAPIVIFSDNDTQKETVLALALGVQGLLHWGMGVEITQQALSFMLQGGSYFPPLEGSRARSSQRNGSVDSAVSNTASEDVLGIASSNDGLTPRQRLVLHRLKRGDTNKTIARALGIRVGTVKVYVRQLMQKFGVDNRTKLAMTWNTATEIAPADRGSPSASSRGVQ
jgi:DNA-binding NarL/FixJ family response regulator